MLPCPFPFSGEGRPQRSGGRGGGDVRMRCPGQAPTRHIVSLRSRCATLPTNGGGMKTRDVLASASEAIHGSAAQDRRWISSSLRPAMTESNRPLQRRHHRACPGDPRPGFVTARKTWMARTSARSRASSPRPAMTTADSRVNCLTDTPPRSRRACARVLLYVLPSETSEGAGNAGRAMHPQPRMQNKKAYEHSHHGHTGDTRHSPRNGFNGFLRALPGDRACLPPSLTESLRQLDASVGASEPHDFAVRISTIRQRRQPRPPHPVPRS